MAQCEVIIGVNVTDLGSETQKRVRFTTTTTPEAVQMGYGTIAAANTYEAVPLGQCDAQNIDLVYIKSIDQTMYVEIMTSVAQACANLVLVASEACLFRPSNSLTVGTAGAVSILVLSGTAEAKYEYLVVGQSS